jgi:predicted dehydrogenase
VDATNLAPVRWGVIGTANIGLQKVIPAMQRAELCSIDAIASRDGATAESAATALAIPRWYASYEELLDDPELEAVYIPLPNHLHAEWAVAAAEAGKHVLCEKPLAMDAAQARSMIDAVQATGMLLMEAFMYRHHPLWQRVRELVDGGVIGELRSIQAVFSYYNVDPANIRNIAAYGGGALMDIGCYPINVARMLYGTEPDVVSARVVRDPGFGIDVLTTAVLDFGGRHAGFTCSTQLESDQRVLLLGTSGRLVVEIPFNIPPDRPTRLIRYWGGDPPVTPESEVYEFAPADQYGIQGDAFSRAVRSGGPVPVPPEDAIGTLDVIHRIIESADTA